MTEESVSPPSELKRIPSGIPAFDAVTQGGFPQGASVVVQSPAGVENVAFLTQFIAKGLKAGGAALVVLTSIPRARFRETTRRAGVDIDRAAADGRLRFVEWQERKREGHPQVAIEGDTFRSSGDLQDVAAAIAQATDSLPRSGEMRAVLEILSPALLTNDPATVARFAWGVKTSLESFGFTSLFSLEKTEDASAVSSLQQGFDGVVEVQVVREGDKAIHKISVLSLKGTLLESGSLPLATNARVPAQLGSTQDDPNPQPAVKGRNAPGEPESQERVGPEESHPPVPPLVERMKAGDLVARSLAIANERLAIDPNDVDALFVKAASFARSGRRRDLVSAVATLETVALLDDKYPGLWRLKAKIHRGLGEREKAEKCQLRALEVDRLQGLAAEPSPRPSVSHESPTPLRSKTSDDGRREGRTNGLARPPVRGVGRTNGIVNGLAVGRGGLTNGLQAGGRTNGLTNGLAAPRRGMTNGLTNGDGFATGIHANRFRRERSRTRWKLYLIPLLVTAFLFLPLLGPLLSTTSRYPVTIDGDARDWDPAGVAAQARSPGLNPNADILKFGIADNVDYLAFYLEVAGNALQGGGTPRTMDTARIFIDADNVATTGYRIDGLGADRMIEISGDAGVIRESRLWEFDANRNPRDWNGWIKPTSIPAAVLGPRIEVEAEWISVVAAATRVTASAAMQSWDGQDDAGDVAVGLNLGSLLVVQQSTVPELVSGSNVPLLNITASAALRSVTFDSVTIRTIGTASPGVATSLRLEDQTGRVLSAQTPTSSDVVFDFPPEILADGSTATYAVVGDFSPGTGNTFGARLPTDAVRATNAVVTLRERPSVRAMGYVGLIPQGPRIDGGFAEWTSMVDDPAGDTGTRGSANIDLRHHEAIGNGSFLYLYADVDGHMFAGTSVPQAPTSAPPSGTVIEPDSDRDTVPDSFDLYPFDFNNDGVADTEAGGDYDDDGVQDYGYLGGTDLWLNTTIPASFPVPYAGRTVSVRIGPLTRPAVFGDDVMRVFLDTDNRTSSGYAVAGIGADRMVEVRGEDGEVSQSAILSFAGSSPGDWSWTTTSTVPVAASYRAIEFAVGVNASGIVFEIGDFWGSADSTAPSSPRPSPPAPTRAWSNPPEIMDIGGNSRYYLRNTNHATETSCGSNRVASTTQGSGPAKQVTLSTGQDACWYADATSGTTIPAGNWESLVDISRSDEIGAIGYKSNTGSCVSAFVNCPKQLDWTGSAWGTPETELATAGAAVENVRTLWDTGTDSTLFWILANTGANIHSYKCTNVDSCSKEDVDPSSGNDYAVTQAVGTAPERHWDAAIEASSGELLLLYDNPAAVANDFCYRTRGGGGSGTWSAETCMDNSAVTTTNPSFAYVTLANNPGSNLIGAGAFDTTNDDFVLQVWNGTAWVNADKACSTTVTKTDGWGGTVAAEDSSNEFVAYCGNGVNSAAECEWTSAGGWEATCATFDPDANPNNDWQNGFARSLDGTDKAMICHDSDISDVSCWRWTGLSGTGGTRGTVFEPTGQDGCLSSGVHACIGFDWNPDQTTTVDGLIVYFENAANSLSYNTYNDGTDGWGTAATFTSAGDHKWIDLRRTRSAGNTNKIFVVASNSNFDILAYRWTGSGAPANEQSVTADTVDETYPYWGLAFANSPSIQYDIRIEIWNKTTDSVVDTIGTCLDATTYGDDVQCLISGVAQKTLASDQVVRIRLVHSSSFSTVTIDYDDADTTGDSRITIPVPEFSDVVVPIGLLAILVVCGRRGRGRRRARAHGAPKIL